MKSINTGFTLALLVTLFSITNASAADTFTPTFEVTSGVSNFGSTGTMSISAPDHGAATHTYVVNAGLGYFFQNGFEWTFTPTLTYLTADDAGHTGLQLLTGPTYNFSPNNIADSFYVTAQVGIFHENESSGDTGISGTAFTYALTVGKRFKLFDHVSYDPTFSFQHVGSYTLSDSAGDMSAQQSNVNWVLTPLQVSILF